MKLSIKKTPQTNQTNKNNNKNQLNVYTEDCGYSSVVIYLEFTRPWVLSVPQNNGLVENRHYGIWY